MSKKTHHVVPDSDKGAGTSKKAGGIEPSNILIKNKMLLILQERSVATSDQNW